MMGARTQISAAAIRDAKKENAKLRERDLAAQLGISEAEYLEAWIDHGVERLNVDLSTFFSMLKDAGEVMALSRNESAVHEKIGVYEGFSSNKHASIVLGPQIDLRIFGKHWAHAYHVTKQMDEGVTQRSFQFFDTTGTAVHKVFARPNTKLEQWDNIRKTLATNPPSKQPFKSVEKKASQPASPTNEAIGSLQADWAALQDTHSFQAMLRRHKLPRLDAIRLVGEKFSTQLSDDAVELLFNRLPADSLPIMVFVRNLGILQIHSGPIMNIKRMGPWLNVLDEGFHLHLRTDHIASTWLVRKPTKRGDIFSIEAFDAAGNQIILINGYRRDGDDTDLLSAWDQVVNSLPKNSEENEN
ncbi:ChuX/HutX family heme-like substrate-binding protein [Ahrensia kielensis]|uniref:ChuX/HutX family heme-like substrate-binding protein n=1 Tax=Ahrensia kielensis TaxID=76980 RepID=A0ABU9T367_9HYPH